MVRDSSVCTVIPCGGERRHSGRYPKAMVIRGAKPSHSDRAPARMRRARHHPRRDRGELAATTAMCMTCLSGCSGRRRRAGGTIPMSRQAATCPTWP